ncbi:Uma2 family endonuclease [Streptomyces sp. CC210A]|uniref:Uma2 family endonuclease n=1 Tax=Streptomyces sp. CC210A TaxID=2898184 RepID=UPI001F27158B|nr:Uma2 family endonuclease [Streptomyces sp. CC210A]
MAISPQHLQLLEEAQRIAPKAMKAEYTDGTVIMQASPSALHQLNLTKVRAQFDRHTPVEAVPVGNIDLVSPTITKSRNPDLTYLPEEALETVSGKIPAGLALIAVEVVSPSHPENDWVGKLRDYPAMGIPLYLIVDPRQKTVTLFSRPDSTKYHRREDIDFGEQIRIPAPFDFDLDTSVLRPH